MEIGNEISHKIRSAIKAKLVELGAYEDEELPDYIMVMVANKKTHAQMNEDLHLFLGGSTEKFTSWLQAILNKLKSITIGNPSILNSVVNADIDDANNSNNSNEDTGVPELLVQTDIDEFAEEQEENSLLNLNEKSVPSDLTSCQATKEALTADTSSNSQLKLQSSSTSLPSSTHYLNPNCKPSNFMSHLQQAINTTLAQPVNTTNPSNAKLSSNKQLPPHLQVDLLAGYSNKQVQKTATGPSGNQTQTDLHPTKVANRKRRIPGSVIGSVIHHSSGEEEEEEYDPYNPSYGSVASVVRVTERKSSVPPELQANKCLLLKAVKDAHKSLSAQEKKNAEKALTKPTASEIPEKRAKLSEKMHQKHMIYSQSKKINNLLAFNTKEHAAVAAEEEEESFELNYAEDDILKKTEDSRLVECKMQHPRIAVLKQVTKPQSQLQGRLNLDVSQEDEGDLQLSVNCANTGNFEEDLSSPLQENNPRIVKDNKRQNPKTQFIVTLDGYDKSQVPKPSVPIVSQSEAIESQTLPTKATKLFNITDTSHEVDEEIAKQKKLMSEKLPETCKFWPSCQNGTNCKYQHPTVPCSKFPNCKFGDKCLYLHPKCKFDTSCNRFDCPFGHSRAPTTTTIPMPLPPPPPPPLPVALPVIPTAIPSVRLRPPCKFFPTCKNMSCPFSHPKPCRFGISCTKKSFCSFYHPPLPKKNQLRWKADGKPQMPDDAASLADQMELNLEQWNNNNNNNPYKVVNAANA